MSDLDAVLAEVDGMKRNTRLCALQWLRAGAVTEGEHFVITAKLRRFRAALADADPDTVARVIERLEERVE